jgi:hypothetical protein
VVSEELRERLEMLRSRIRYKSRRHLAENLEGQPLLGDGEMRKRPEEAPEVAFMADHHRGDIGKRLHDPKALLANVDGRWAGKELCNGGQKSRSGELENDGFSGDGDKVMDAGCRQDVHWVGRRVEEKVAEGRDKLVDRGISEIARVEQLVAKKFKCFGGRLRLDPLDKDGREDRLEVALRHMS